MAILTVLSSASSKWSAKLLVLLIYEVQIAQRKLFASATAFRLQRTVGTLLLWTAQGRTCLRSPRGRRPLSGLNYLTTTTKIDLKMTERQLYMLPKAEEGGAADSFLLSILRHPQKQLTMMNLQRILLLLCVRGGEESLTAPVHLSLHTSRSDMFTTRTRHLINPRPAKTATRQSCRKRQSAGVSR